MALWKTMCTFGYYRGLARNAGIHDFGKVRMIVLGLSRGSTNYLDLVRGIV